MLVEPRMLPALVEENGLKSRLTGPDGLLSMTRVWDVPVLFVVLGVLDPHAASASAAAAPNAVASTAFFLIIAPGVRPAGCRQGWDSRLCASVRRCAASRPPCDPRQPIPAGAVAPSRSAWRGGIGGGTGSPTAVRSGWGQTPWPRSPAGLSVPD